MILKSPKVFISYSHDSPAHADRVLAFSNRLREDGIEAILDQYAVAPPEGWPRWMDKQIRDADFVLMLCTETYYRRVMGEEEAGKGLGVRWEGNLIYNHIYQNESLNPKFIPVLFEGGQVKHIPTPLQSVTIYWVDREEDYDRLYRYLTDQPRALKSELGEIRRLPPLQPQERKIDFFRPWNVPHPPNPYFTGREQVLANLHTALTTQKSAALAQAISGFGGIGKTQTAVQYAYQHRDEYTAVLWASAVSKDTLFSDFAQLAMVLNLPEKDAREQQQAVDAVQRWLRTQRGWLLILDNADQPEILTAFIPPDHQGHILLTSRARVFDMLGIPQPVALAKMPLDEAREFLLKRTGHWKDNSPSPIPSHQGRGELFPSHQGRGESFPSHKGRGEIQTPLPLWEGLGEGEGHALAELLTELDGLPLALEQAGAYILRMQCSFSAYLAGYRKHKLTLLEKGKPLNYPQSVATTWALNFEQVEQASPAAADILRLSAFLHPDAIPLEILTKGATALGDTLSAALAAATDDSLELAELLAPLTQFSLIRRDPEAKTYTIHRLIQLALQATLDESARRQWAERAVRAVNQAFPGGNIEFSEWPHCERLLPQAQTCAELIGQDAFVFPEAARLLNQAGLYLHYRAHYAEAEPLYLRALTIREQALGLSHPEVSTCLNNLAALYHDQDNWIETELLYLRALTIREEALGPNHPAVADILNNMANLYCDQSNLTAAERLYRRALTIREQTLGLDHPDIAQNLNDFALFYKTQGNLTAAEPLYLRALTILEQASGLTHPNVATILNNLAELYRAQGNLTAAEPLYRRALTIWEEALGETHPNVATCLENYAVLLRALGRETEAAALEARAAASRARHAQQNAGEDA
jgi:tetratricopeptide (TPR) repeat protein